MIWTLNPETHSSISSQSSHVSFFTRIASVALMFPWHDEKRAAWSIASSFQSSTRAVGVEVADAAAVAERPEDRDVGDVRRGGDLFGHVAHLPRGDVRRQLRPRTLTDAAHPREGGPSRASRRAAQKPRRMRAVAPHTSSPSSG